MCALVTGVQTCALPICGLVGIAGFTAGQVGPDATLVQHARELRGLGRTPASTHADYADLRNWSLFEPQFGLCGQPLVHLFEAVVNDGPSLLRTRNPVDRKTVVSGKRVSVSVDLGGRRIIQKNKNLFRKFIHNST